MGRTFGAFLRRGAATIVFATLALFLALHDAELNPLPPELRMSAAVACAVLAGLLAVRFLVGWHRYALGPEIVGPQRLRFAITYLRATLAVLLLALLPAIAALLVVAVLGPAVSLPAAVLAGFLMAVIVGKLALSWPAAAVGRRHVMRHGWVMSSGLVPQLVLILVFTVGPFAAAAGGVLYVVTAIPLSLPGPLLFAAAFLALLGKAAGAAALSLAYRWRLRQDNSHWWRLAA